MNYETHKNGLEGLQFLDATLADLVVGSRLWLRDPRRTPVMVSNIDPATASFTVIVSAFEDKGANWVLPLWDISKFFAGTGGERSTEIEQKTLRTRIRAFRKHLSIVCSPEDFKRSHNKITMIEREIEAWASANRMSFGDPNGLDIVTGQGAENLRLCFIKWMNFKGLLEADKAFIRSYSSNPYAGELIKGHRIVMAEIGLCPYAGDMPRDPTLFDGSNSKPERAKHILTRLAFVRTAFRRLGFNKLQLYRAVYSNDTIEPPRNTGFVSATVNYDVALDLFEAGKKGNQAAIFWQNVPIDRVFATHLETPSLSAPYEEAEAVLIFDPNAIHF